MLDPAAADGTRRRNARDLLQRVFLDEDPPQPDDHRNFGAGPVAGFSDEDAIDLGDGFKASETLSVPSEGAGQGFNPAGYNPSDPNRPYQLNGYGTGESSNHPAGDMVSGTYHNGQPHAEAGDYSRPDFLPDTAAPSSTTPAGDTFLVRMRRSNEGQQPDLGLSSGPAVPYLFGRGSLLATPLKGRGITVRATSLANAQPAMTVGNPVPPEPATSFPGISGVAPFALDQAFWALWQGLDDPKQPPFVDPVYAQFNLDGTITAKKDNSPNDPGGSVIGPATLSAAVDATIASIQVKIDPLPATALAGAPRFPAVPFTVRVGGGNGGVQFETMTVLSIDPSNPLKWNVQRGSPPSAHTSGDPVALLFGMVTRSTTPTANVDAAATTIGIASPDGFPMGSGPVNPGEIAEGFTIQVGNEPMKVIDGFNTTSWTVERGSNATSHSSGDPVSQVSAASFGQTVTFRVASTIDPNNGTRMQNLLRSYPGLFITSSDPATADLLPLTIDPPLYLKDAALGADWVVAFGGVWMNFPVAAETSRLVVTLQRYNGWGLPAAPAQQGPRMQQSLRLVQQNKGFIATDNASATPQGQFQAIQALESLGVVDQDHVNPLLVTLLQSRAGTLIPVRAPALVRSE